MSPCSRFSAAFVKVSAGTAPAQTAVIAGKNKTPVVLHFFANPPPPSTTTQPLKHSWLNQTGLWHVARFIFPTFVEWTILPATEFNLVVVNSIVPGTGGIGWAMRPGLFCFWALLVGEGWGWYTLNTTHDIQNRLLCKPFWKRKSFWTKPVFRRKFIFFWKNFWFPLNYSPPMTIWTCEKLSDEMRVPSKV